MTSSGPRRFTAALALTVTLFMLSLTRPGHADGMRPFSLRVLPSDARVQLVDDAALIFDLPRTAQGFQTSLDTSVIHHVAITHPWFDTVLLTLSWSNQTETWQARDELGNYHELSQPLMLAKSFRLNVDPSDATVWLVGEGSDTRTIIVNGHAVGVHPPPLRKDGRITLWPAVDSHTLVLTRHLFYPREVVLHRQLDTSAELIPSQPIRLRPRYGPFSYEGFDEGLCLTLAVLVVGALMVRVARGNLASWAALEEEEASRQSGGSQVD